MTTDDPVPGSGQVARAATLRMRRRVRTKHLIQTEALRLFAERGFASTTIDEIADAAAISSRTFFRYFPTKEEVVLWDEYDEIDNMVAVGVRARASAGLLGSFIGFVRDMLADLWRDDPDRLLTRVKLCYAVPEIRSRLINRYMEQVGPALAGLAEAWRLPRDDLHLRVLVSASFAAVLVAIERWQDGDGRDDLLGLFDEGIALLAAGAAELQAVVDTLPGAKLDG